MTTSSKALAGLSLTGITLVTVGAATGVVHPRRVHEPKAKTVTVTVTHLRSARESTPPGVTEMSPGDYFIKTGYTQNAWHLCNEADEHGGGIRRMRSIHGGIWVECYYVNDKNRLEQPKNLSSQPQGGVK